MFIFNLNGYLSPPILCNVWVIQVLYTPNISSQLFDLWKVVCIWIRSFTFLLCETSLLEGNHFIFFFFLDFAIWLNHLYLSFSKHMCCKYHLHIITQWTYLIFQWKPFMKFSSINKANYVSFPLWLIYYFKIIYLHWTYEDIILYFILIFLMSCLSVIVHL